MQLVFENYEDNREPEIGSSYHFLVVQVSTALTINNHTLYAFLIVLVFYSLSSLKQIY
jgi:hypothetical protein